MRRSPMALLAMACSALSCSESYDVCRNAGPEGDPPPSYAETLDEFAGPLREDGSREFCSSVGEGRCADGKQFVYRAGIFVFEVRYFNEEGEYVASAAQGDVASEPCDGAGFHPSLSAVRCQRPDIMPLCEGGFSVTSFPFDDGEP